LKTLQMSNTQVNDLTPLQGLESLEKVYADNTFVTESEAQDFTNANPSVLIIINSEALSAWWASLDPNWKQAFKNYMPGYSGSIPPKEQLTRLLSIDSLAVSASGIRELFPLKKFSRLRYLDISQNSLRELRPLRGLSGLNYLDASGNTITDISPLLSLKKLQYLNLADNEVSEESFQQLSLLRSLERLNVNGMDIKRMAVAQFLEQINNKCIVRYNDVQTQSWWNSLDNKWKQILRVQLSIGNSPDSWELHRLLALPRIVIVDEGIASLDPLAPFIQLQSLYLERVGLQNLSSLNSIQTLTELSIIETPVTDISPVSTIKSLKSLTLDFSAVEDLRPLESLEDLEELSVAGTKVDKLKGLENLYMLRFLDVSSTQVKKLKRLDIINNLEQVVCYNTRINDRRLEKFKEEHPDCAVRWY
jgi:Leucine-rich repeat (LRR) protein